MINSYELECGIIVSEERDDKGRLIHRWNSIGEDEIYKYEEHQDGEYLIIKSHHKEIVSNPEDPKEWGEWDDVSGFYKDGYAMNLDKEYDDEGNIAGYSILPRFKSRLRKD